MAYLRRLLYLNIHLFVGVGGRGEVKKRREGLLEEVAVHVGTSLLCMCVCFSVCLHMMCFCVCLHMMCFCVCLHVCVCLSVCMCLCERE